MRKIFTFILFTFLGISQIYAQLAYNTTMTQSDFNNSSVVIEKHATENRVDWADNGIRLGYYTGLFGVQMPGDWADKYVVIALNQQSIPNQLTFKYKVNFAISSNPNWRVEESADNSTWSTVWANESRNTDWSDQQVLTLSKSTKYIKLAFTGNYSGTFADISVSDQAYVHNPKVNDKAITSLDFGTGNISSGKAELTFDVEWCNVNTLSVTCDNTDVFSVSPASFGGKAKYGTQTVKVSYDRDVEVNDHTGTITITNGSTTKTVTLSGSTTKRGQDIHWNAALEATNFTMNAEEALSEAQIATADNEEAEITFASDNDEVIAVSPDGKTIYAVANGTANITVSATGNEIYTDVTDNKQFTVTADKKQTITWDQNFMSLKTDANPKSFELTATATSGGVVTYVLEDGSDICVTLSGENNEIMTITGTPGVAYVVATQEGGEINGEVWIAASARKQIKVRDPNAACDEYALADQSFTFAKGDKTTMAEQEYSLIGKPTQLTFTAKWGGKKYSWSEQQEMMIDQYANFGSGLEWRQVTSFKMSNNTTNYGPYNLDETATKIRFRSGEHGEQNVYNISVPRKKELIVSETNITENAERNVRWSKTISVSRSNIDVVDILVESTDPNCPFEVSKTSIGTDCADRSTETFEVHFTPLMRDSVYTGTITITDGKAVPTTRTIQLSVHSIGFNQSISGFDVPEECLTTDEVQIPQATASSGLEVVYLSSDSTIAYVENGQLQIIKAGVVDITAYQAGNDKYNEASLTRTITIQLTPIELLAAPTASEIPAGAELNASLLQNGSANVEGAFRWENGDEVMEEVGLLSRNVIFVPENDTIYASLTIAVEVSVSGDKVTPTIIKLPAFGSIVYGQTLEEAEYTAGEANVPGTFEFLNEGDLSELLDAGDQEIYMLFVPEDDEKYEETEVIVIVHIDQATPEIGDYPTAVAYEEDPETLSDWSLEDGTADVDGLFVWEDEDITPRPGTHEYNVIFLPDDDVNYESVTIQVSVYVSESGTALDNTEDAARAAKELRNGVLYIRRSEKIFTIEGHRVK